MLPRVDCPICHTTLGANFAVMKFTKSACRKSTKREFAKKKKKHEYIILAVRFRRFNIASKQSVFLCLANQGRIQKFQKGRGGSRILERGGRNLTFQCRFPSFSYKSLTNIPPKGGGAAARPAPPLNPRLLIVYRREILILTGLPHIRGTPLRFETRCEPLTWPPIQSRGVFGTHNRLCCDSCPYSPD